MARIGTNIDDAKDCLDAGELVAIPTETVYGLAGNALDPEAVAKIFETKNRPSFDPLILHCHSLDQVRTYVGKIPALAEKLAEQFWPGPLTLLLPKLDIIPDIVTSGMVDVAVRIPDNTLTISLLKSLKYPLVAPSANPFGYISPTSAQHVNDQLGTKIPYILDGGNCAVGVESTIIGFPDGVATVYRLGGLRTEELESIVGHVEVLAHSSSDPKAPGMLKSHYAPHKPFHIISSAELIEMESDDDVAILTFSAQPNNSFKYVRVLAPDENLNTAAKNLFKYMRELDELPVNRIFTELVPEEGLGRAINDRLKRAAAD